METPVDTHEVIKILTSDQNLVRNWKNLFVHGLGLSEADLYEFEKRFRTYEPVEDIFTCIIEKWNESNKAKKLIQVLENLGFGDVTEQLDKHFERNHAVFNAFNKTQPKLKKMIEIPDKSIGHSYASIFGPFLDGSVKTVFIQDPSIQSAYQLNNLDQFLHLLQTKCPNLTEVHLTVRFDDRKDRGHIRKYQAEQLTQLVMKLNQESNMDLILTYDQRIMESCINIQGDSTDNSLLFLLNRGLDIYYSCDKDSEAWSDLSFRKCKSVLIYCTRDAKNY